MQALDDITLLREYAERDSEEAFATLVTRHINKVYSVALRHTRNPNQAEEITQAVFVILAKKARHLGRGVILSGWLYQTARLTALTFIRGEIRRARRDQEAHMQTLLNETDSDVWPHIAALLDTAMAGLSEVDRHAILLRYFDGRTMGEVGDALGASEDAAKKRVNRAVEKLRLFFTRHGITLSAAVLTAAISANSVQAAPPTLAKSISVVAAAKGAAAGGSTSTLIQGALKYMAWAKAKTAIAGTLVIASLVIPLMIQHQAQAKMRDEDETFRQQAERLTKLKAENDRLSHLAAESNFSQKQLGDLQKLREEIGSLRQQANGVAQLREENRKLKAKTGQDKPKTPMQIKEEAVAKMSYGKNWMIAFYQYSTNNQGRFPTNFEQAAAFVPDKIKNQADVTTDQFEITFQGSRSALKKPQDVIVVREKEAWNAGESSHPPGQWARIYAFADGHIEIHHEMENNFDAYEQKHTIAPPANP
jgi:RNA polymerase sigma factor (sigma-70 family)